MDTCDLLASLDTRQTLSFKQSTQKKVLTLYADVPIMQLST